MDNNNLKALKSGIWYTFSNFMIKGIGFITTPIFTRLLTKEEFGVYNNYLSWLALITIFVTLNLESTLISARFDFEEKFDEYILSILSLSTLSGIICLILANVFSSLVSEFLGLSNQYINIMFIYLILCPSVSLFQSREQYRFEYKINLIISLFIAVGTALLSVLLVVFMKDKLMGRIIGAVIPTALLGVVLYFFFIKKGKQICIKYWKYALPICLPYIPHLLSMTFLNSTDRVMINKWCGPEATALYSLAYTVGTIVTVLLSSINNAYAPWMGEKLNEGKHQDINSFSKIYMSVFLFLAIGTMLVAPEVLYIYGGEKYMESKYVMTPVAMGCVCQFLYTMFVNVEQFKKKTIGMAFASAIAAIVNFILNYIFIPKIGYLAAAYTTLVGYTALLLIHMFLVHKLKLNDVYNYKFVYLVFCIGIISMIIVTALYSTDIFRYIICFLYVIIAIIMVIKNKQRIIGFIKEKEVK